MSLRVYAYLDICYEHEDKFKETYPGCRSEWLDVTHPDSAQCTILEADGRECKNTPCRVYGLVIENKARDYGAAGGRAKTDAKSAASRDNGKKGGRPKRVMTQPTPAGDALISIEDLD